MELCALSVDALMTPSLPSTDVNASLMRAAMPFA